MLERSLYRNYWQQTALPKPDISSNGDQQKGNIQSPGAGSHEITLDEPGIDPADSFQRYKVTNVFIHVDDRRWRGIGKPQENPAQASESGATYATKEALAQGLASGSADAIKNDTSALGVIKPNAGENRADQMNEAYGWETAKHNKQKEKQAIVEDSKEQRDPLPPYLLSKLGHAVLKPHRLLRKSCLTRLSAARLLIKMR